MRSALVLGTGLVGTSIALALSDRGVTVHLSDVDPSMARTAASLGAGVLDVPTGPVDLAVVAVPPAFVGSVIAKAQADKIAHHYTDVASVKTRPQQGVLALGCDTARYIGGHPMAGSERSGPLAARADLFDGRSWVLTPTSDTETETLNTGLELATLCGATPVVMDAAAHDQAVALVSHMPHLVAALVAMRLERADERVVSLAGSGVRDLTRIAAGDPRLWTDILRANAAVVSDILDELAADLDDAVTGLRAMAAVDGDHSGAATVEDLLRRGTAGRARISGKHGVQAVRCEAVTVHIGDQPGELARLFTDAGHSGVNIEDVRLEHAVGQPAGLVHLSVVHHAAAAFKEDLQGRGWRIR